jgi:S1-C subfamily serine protease
MLGELSELELFQTDAAINTGNSGGPMFSSDGKVIGIVSRILTRSGGFEGMGFAVPSNLARQLLLEEPTPWSGLEGYMLSDDLAKIFNLPQDAGLLVQRVARNSMAERIGLRSGKLHAEINSEKLLVGGDVLLAVGGIQVDVSPETRNKIRQHLRDLKEDADLKVEVLRAGEVVELSRRMGDL